MTRRGRVLRVLEKEEIPVDFVRNISELAVDPHMLHRKSVLSIDDPDSPGKKTVLVPGIVPKLQNFPRRVKSLGPTLGEHNQEIYRKHLGLSAEKNKELEKKEII